MFLQMIANRGMAPNGTRILSEESVAVMLSEQTNGAPILYSPYTQYGTLDSLLPKSRYGIGLWRETAAFDKLPSPDLTSPGAFGFAPWIDPDRNLIGVFSVLSLLQTTAPTYFAMKQLLLQEIDAVTTSTSSETSPPDRLDLY